jgi:hypothetical protein
MGGVGLITIQDGPNYYPRELSCYEFVAAATCPLACISDDAFRLDRLAFSG